MRRFINITPESPEGDFCKAPEVIGFLSGIGGGMAKYPVWCFFIICHLSLVTSFAQEKDNLNRELVLVRPYEPSVTDAQKISTLPSLKDSFSIKPAFEYSIRSRRIDTRFDVSPIAPAKLQPLPQPKLYHGYIKAGAGAGSIPNVLGEAAFNTLRSKDYAAGGFFKYNGATGKVKLDNGEKVFAGNTDAVGKVYGQKFLHSAILYGDAGASGTTAYNYGYNTRAVDAAGIPIDTSFAKGDIRKRYFFADANIGIRSSHFKTEQLNYDLQLGYKYAHNKLDDMYVPNYVPDPDGSGYVKYNENAVNFKAQLDNNMFGGNVNFDLFNRSNAFDSLRHNFAVDINPWFTLDNDSIRLQVGMRLAMYKEGDGNMQYKIYPKMEFQFTLLKDIFIPFVGIDGYLRPNTWRSLVTENPFITPGLAVPLTKTKLQVYAGLKGTLTTKLSYYLRADFSTSEKECFFVNDTSYSRVQNYFTVVTDDLNTFSLKGELYFNPVESLDLDIKATYFSYQPSTERYAWHKPEYTIEFNAKYNLRNKIITNFGIMSIGKRYAKTFYDPENEYSILKGVIDFNLGVEYRYTKSLSFFLKLNNLSGTKYYRWNFYPSQRFNAMVGFTYSL
ncbi:MAG: hypothetical protein LBL24_09370 [Bacteroidales bacterium]|jgi:hypothetical protein|nr:hypothetical protein [Bacteroidales bacterium]